MIIEYVAIGNEVLSGRTVNTNAATLSRLLLAHGVHLSATHVFPDDTKVLKKALKQMMGRLDCLILSGGLGPTGDDVTRSVLSDLFDAPLVYDNDLAFDLKKRYGKLETLEDQAHILKGSQIIPNPLGTAVGYILSQQNITCIALPGVPDQMEEMVIRDVIPFLVKKSSKREREKACFLWGLPEEQVDPFLRDLEKTDPTLSISICPSYRSLALYFHTRTDSLEEGNRKLLPVIEEVKKRFPLHVFSETSDRIELALHDALIKKEKTLCLAESCTGGEIASLITHIPGASSYFLGGVVAYSNALKCTALDVSQKVLNEKGAVSREVVLEMLSGILKLTGADYGIAVSGIAGPGGGTKEKPVGTVWGAIGKKGEEGFAEQVNLKGARRRDTLINYVSTYLLYSLWRWICFNRLPFQYE